MNKAITERSESSFRGYWAIKEVKDKVDKLASALDLLGKSTQRIALAPVDFDLLVRWPRAAKINGFTITAQGGVFLAAHPLHRHVGAGRYEH